ncbi:enteropeptidase [Ciona intestinalis]
MNWVCSLFAVLGCVAVAHCSNFRVELANSAPRRVVFFPLAGKTNFSKLQNYLETEWSANRQVGKNLHLPESTIDALRAYADGDVTTASDPEFPKYLKVAELAPSLADVILGSNSQRPVVPRQNVTCSFQMTYTCTRRVLERYTAICLWRLCDRYRYVNRLTQCTRTQQRCCTGYSIAASGYCERETQSQTTDSGCGNPRRLVQRNGILQSTGYPSIDYKANLNCRWSINVPLGYKAILKVLDLDMENGNGVCNLEAGTCYQQCSFDHLRIFGTRPNNTKILCGNLAPFTEYESVGNLVEIAFTTDDSVYGRGFKIVYSVVPVSALRNTACPNGQVWQKCRRKCALTCQNNSRRPSNSIWRNCIESTGRTSVVSSTRIDDVICTPGCTCPSSRPVLYGNRCEKIEFCPSTLFQCGKSIPRPSPKIIGGRWAGPGEYPWMVQITTNDEHAVCGATLICSNWVVTAAHCFLKKRGTFVMPDPIDKLQYLIHVGKYWKYGQQDRRRVQTYRASRIIIHPQYNHRNDREDIALIELDGYVADMTHARPICLPSALGRHLSSEYIFNQTNGYPNVGDTCKALGWGITRNIGPSATILKELDMVVAAGSGCASYHDYNWRKILCAGGEAGRDTCKGDSGGPFLCVTNSRWYIHGITSFGHGCARGVPGGYTRVSNYINWIRLHVGQLCGVVR